MKKIALVNRHTNRKTYFVNFHDQVVTWPDQAAAEHQIRCLSLTCGYGPATPSNFSYVIEDA